ncbi:MAG: hypothetical protein IKA87_09580 [Lentisphaeria bacterium]|nr:hypothetical protein [Lentisphaeria bacterium]
MKLPRFVFLLTVFAAGFIVCAVKGCRLAGLDREKIIARGERIARTWRNIPAKRGRILDRNGKVLVWSELYFDLHYKDGKAGKLSDEEKNTLSRLLGKIDFDAKTSQPLRRHLKPEHLVALEPVLLKGAPLKIVSRHERLHCDSETVHRLAGKVELRHGIQNGLSGWELEHELVLRGIPGTFSILLDRFGNYMPKSFKLVSPPSDGRDVQLLSTLEELERQELKK